MYVVYISCTFVIIFCLPHRPDSDGTNPDQHEPLPAEYQRMFGSSPTPAASTSNTTTQEQEEDDLQLAIAMSLNEQENKVSHLLMQTVNIIQHLATP